MTFFVKMAKWIPSLIDVRISVMNNFLIFDSNFSVFFYHEDPRSANKPLKVSMISGIFFFQKNYKYILRKRI